MADQLRSMHELRAIAFDLDWTLSYYPASTQEILAASLARVGEPTIRVGDLDAAAGTYDSLWVETERSCASIHETRAHLWDHLLQAQGIHDPALADRLATAYDAIRRETGVRLYDGAEELLDGLRPHVRLGMITNGSTEMQWEKIDQLALRDRFDEILVAGDLGIYKPDPRIFLRLAEALGVSPAETLFVGDSFESDVVGAAAAGMRTAWIRPQSNALHPPMPIDRTDIRPDYEWETVCDLKELLS